MSTKEPVAGDLPPIAESIDDEAKVKSNDEEKNEEKIDAKENEEDTDESVSPMIAMHIVYIMPFFLKLSSTLPPVYLSVALMDNFGESGVKAGLVIGMFQAARAAVICITLYSPLVSICCGSFFGVLGFVCLALYPIWKDSTYAFALFSVANVVIGLTNAFSALQIFAKQEYSKDMAGLRFALRRQSVVSGVACIISYFSSGIMYDKLGLAYVGFLGCLCVGIASVSLVFYLIARKPQPTNDVIEDRDDEQGGSSVFQNDTSMKSADTTRDSSTGTRHFSRRSARPGFSNTVSWKSIKHSFLGISEEEFQQTLQDIGSFGHALGLADPNDLAMSNEDKGWASEVTNLEAIEEIEENRGSVNEDDIASRTSCISPVGHRCRTSRLNTHLENALQSNELLACDHQEELFNYFSGAGEVVLNKIVFVVASAFLIEALTSGSLFSVGPFYIQETFGKSTSYTGIVFGLSSVFGTIFTMLFISDKGKEIVRKVLPSSSEIYSLMLIISLATLALIVPSFPVQIICVMFVIGFNETLWALLTEMEGAITTEKFYRSIGPAALLLHKIINFVVSLLCPILIDVKRWLPYALTGGIALLFSLFFVWKIEAQRRRNAKLIAKVVAKKRMTKAQTRAMRMSFTTLETLTRMASVKQKRDQKKKKQSVWGRISLAFTGTKGRISQIVTGKVDDDDVA